MPPSLLPRDALTAAASHASPFLACVARACIVVILAVTSSHMQALLTP